MDPLLERAAEGVQDQSEVMRATRVQEGAPTPPGVPTDRHGPLKDALDAGQGPRDSPRPHPA